MKHSSAFAGTFHNGVPYNRVGHGPRNLILFQGLVFDSKPLPAWLSSLYTRYYKFLAEDYTTYIVTRKQNLPQGYTIQDMAADYAVMIREEFGEAVDIIGVSTGGSIALQFAADHPDLLRKLVVHSSAYTLTDATRAVQMRVGELARQRKWQAAYAAMLAPTRYPRAVIWLGSFLAGTFAVPEDPADLVVTVEAEDKFNLKERLGEITAPTLVVAGEQDPFYTPALFRATAEGIPNARLILYKGMGHPASGKQFRQDVLTFLKEGAMGER